MGLFVRQDENRSEIQSKIVADLQEKTRAAAKQAQNDVDPRYLENQHETRPAGIIIGFLLLVLVIAAVAFVAVQTN